MQRYFVETEHWQGQAVTIDGEDVHHISRVMRMEPGSEVVCIHPVEGAALCRIEEIKEKTVDCEVLEWMDEDRELPVEVTIVQSLGKGDKLEQVVQKGTELGASRFIPFAADRSVAKWDLKKVKKKVERLQKIAKEASEQSERTRIPEVSSLYQLQDLLKEESFTWCFFGHAEEARDAVSPSLKSRLTSIEPGDKVLIVFGPEGGFSEKEVEAFKDSGYLPVRLGPRILRMETAPLYFLSSLSYQVEEE
ncbi:16S rRNA (uracil(1498)-N(3))-methyltransferase [Halobacillus litoralis]|uniref:16S rRNA (uracil(1498)-N(3))-methyltransferase n=1 Tax=Halobacillus litoralis TaxID=45668 RepID=UPI001CD70A47|nr:16S rRNA (uracil(1498)-N(3))-methyltransferase [Halobacillus litoralis]MCA0970031.1 16S rRNA (uracil(1498)-N(3))-methyltransferase [Halobacillus litoralis]